MSVLRATARMVGRDQTIAEDLWRSGLHEARILAARPDRTARWIGRDALRELTYETVQRRLQG